MPQKYYKTKEIFVVNIIPIKRKQIYGINIYTESQPIYHIVQIYKINNQIIFKDLINNNQTPLDKYYQIIENIKISSFTNIIHYLNEYEKSPLISDELIKEKYYELNTINQNHNKTKIININKTKKKE